MTDDNSPARDEDAAWAEIVASLSAEGVGGRVPPPPPEPPPPEPEPWLDVQGQQSLFEAAEAEVERLLPEEHFVPPEPPPIPRGDMVAVLSWAGVLGGPAVLFLAAVVGWSPPMLVVGLALVGFVAGFFVLVGRMRSDDEHDADGGAVV